MRELRFITYLAPGIPRELYALAAAVAGERLGLETSLEVDDLRSGPLRGADDPFSSGRADVGFMCAPAYIWLRERRPAPVELVPAAPVHADPRNEGAPVYYSDVVVPASSPARSFVDLRGATFGLNDPCSLSGYYNVLKRLAELGEAEGFFGRLELTGGHLRSLERVAAGALDGAAIDSNVLRLAVRRQPELGRRLRVVESWGPFPVQPVVIRTGLPIRIRDGLGAALLDLGRARTDALSALGVLGFAPVAPADYDGEARTLSECEGRRVAP